MKDGGLPPLDAIWLYSEAIFIRSWISYGAYYYGNPSGLVSLINSIGINDCHCILATYTRDGIALLGSISNYTSQWMAYGNLGYGSSGLYCLAGTSNNGPYNDRATTRDAMYVISNSIYKMGHSIYTNIIAQLPQGGINTIYSYSALNSYGWGGAT